MLNDKGEVVGVVWGISPMYPTKVFVTPVEEIRALFRVIESVGLR